MSENPRDNGKLNLVKNYLNAGKSIVFIGMPGAGKTTLARKLAFKLDAPFIDTDKEIEIAAQISISEIFEKYGEAHFRDFERKIITRLLKEQSGVFATGGGAFIDETLRDAIAESGVSVWLQADLDTLADRTYRKDHRPLLKTDDPKTVLKDLLAQREPVYALCDIKIHNNESVPDAAYETLLDELTHYFDS